MSVHDDEAGAPTPQAELAQVDVDDLPGGTNRLYAGSCGIDHVWVSGIETVRDGRATGSLPGAVLRSGVDTDTVTSS